MMNDLLEKIKKIEALIEGAKTDGEKNAAISAKDRLNNRLFEAQKSEKIEFKLYTADNWHKKLLLAICRKHGLSPYRYRRQKHTTVMVRSEEVILNKVWLEFQEYSRHLELLVFDITNNLINKIHSDQEEDIIQGNLI